MTAYKNIQQTASRINWQLLLFLVLVLNVKLVVKVAAILLFLLLNPKLFREKTIYRQRFIWFYTGMIGISVINLLLALGTISVNQCIAVFTGISFWLLCIAAACIISWLVKQTDIGRLHTTATVFFILNSLITAAQLGLIIWDTGSLNPFTYQGMHQKYFISTGDRMTGISFDVCTTNALLNAFGIVYFIGRNKMHFVLLCMTTLLLTASNFSNVLLVIVLLYLFIFQSTRDQKSIIIVCLLLLGIFLIKVSPQNNRYLAETYARIAHTTLPDLYKPLEKPLTERPDSLLSPDQQKQKIATLYLDSFYKVKMEIARQEYMATHPFADVVKALVPAARPAIPKPDIHSEPYQRRRDTSVLQKELLAFAKKNLPVFDPDLQDTKARKLPGKLIALKQTLIFLKEHPGKILTGTGTGNFSSKLAFRSTGLGVAGGYPEKISYINPAFLNNHLSLYLDYFSKDAEMHSFTNSPNSVYDQLLAEYGIIGFILFIVCYLGFFIKRCTGYGLPLLLILLGAFGVEYWFEQLSIIILFELLMLINIKENRPPHE